MARHFDSTQSFYERSTARPTLTDFDSTQSFYERSKRRTYSGRSETRVSVSEEPDDASNASERGVTSADILASCDDTPPPVTCKYKDEPDEAEPGLPPPTHKGFAGKRRIMKGVTPPRIATKFESTES
jgi:hypothetical protein